MNESEREKGEEEGERALCEGGAGWLEWQRRRERDVVTMKPFTSCKSSTVLCVLNMGASVHLSFASLCVEGGKHISKGRRSVCAYVCMFFFGSCGSISRSKFFLPMKLIGAKRKRQQQYHWDYVEWRCQYYCAFYSIFLSSLFQFFLPALLWIGLVL